MKQGAGEMSGGVSQVAVSNCVFDGADGGIRIKCTRGRGGIVENVRVSNVVMRDVREEAIILNPYYTKAPAEPLSARTRRFRNIHISGVSGKARQAGLLLGLPESPLDGGSMDDVDVTAKTGFVIKDARNTSLRAVHPGIVHGCFAAPGTDVSIQIAGADSQSLLIGGNRFLGVKNPVTVAKDARAGSLVLGNASVPVVAPSTPFTFAPPAGGPVHVSP